MSVGKTLNDEGQSREFKFQMLGLKFGLLQALDSEVHHSSRSNSRCRGPKLSLTPRSDTSFPGSGLELTNCIVFSLRDSSFEVQVPRTNHQSPNTKHQTPKAELISRRRSLSSKLPSNHWGPSAENQSPNFILQTPRTECWEPIIIINRQSPRVVLWGPITNQQSSNIEGPDLRANVQGKNYFWELNDSKVWTPSHPSITKLQSYLRVRSRASNQRPRLASEGQTLRHLFVFELRITRITDLIELTVDNSVEI